jgi:hypothetical protein
VINPKFFDRREGIVARVVDRGATGMSVIGQFKLKPGATTRPGALRFQPNSVKPEPRVVEVFFERNGLPVGYEQLDTYMSSAPPAPPAPRGVEVRTSGSRLQVRWDRMTGVSKYEVAVTTNDGRRLSFTTRANGLIEKMPFERWDAVKVQVRAVSRLGRRGAASTDLIKARAPKPRVRFTPAQVKALNRLPRA